MGGCRAGKSFGFIAALSPNHARLNVHHASTVLSLPQITGPYHKKRVQGAQKNLLSRASGRTETEESPGSQQWQGPQK